MRSVTNRKLPKYIKFYCLSVGTFILGYVLGINLFPSWCEVTEHHSTIDHPPYSGFLLVIIFSAPQNLERRDAIRKTWILTKKRTTLHFFAVGSQALDADRVSQLQWENSKHGDLLILDSVGDSFSMLSEKLREVLIWASKHAEFDFLLKVDDDSFARLDELYKLLLKQPRERLYWGFFDGQARVKSRGKWVEKNWFLCDRYLPYAKGGGYVLSRDLVQKLVLVSDYLALYKNEDVSLGTWLAPFDIKRTHDPLFDTEYAPRGCMNSYLVTHKQSIAMLYSKYENLMRTGKMCASEHKFRNSYQYNWNVLPSQCCLRNDSRIP